LRTALSFAPPEAATDGAAAANAQPPPTLAFVPGATDAPGAAFLSRLRILAQLDDTYILATDGSALVLIDQHAAHERVAFEAIAARALRGRPLSEALLLPYTVELEAEEATRFEASRAALAEGGLDAEPFGERAYRIVATPAGYGARAFDMRAYVTDLGDEIPGLDARQRVWASLACHSVVRAGEALEHSEMSALVARLAQCENAMHCPHGRPTIVRVEADAIARLFKRT
jgi:DNA mismatch repair protein MutL